MRRTQPRPVETRCAAMPCGLQTVTAIYRRWAPGESRQCRLCPACGAQDDACLILVNQRVEASETPLYDATAEPDLNWIDPSAAPLGHELTLCKGH